MHLARRTLTTVRDSQIKIKYKLQGLAGAAPVSNHNELDDILSTWDLESIGTNPTDHDHEDHVYLLDSRDEMLNPISNQNLSRH